MFSSRRVEDVRVVLSKGSIGDDVEVASESSYVREGLEGRRGQSTAYMEVRSYVVD